MDIQKQRSKLLKNVASLPGGRDRSGSPIIVIDPPVGNVSIDAKSASTSDVGAVYFPYEDLVSLLGYLAEVPDKASLQKGFCVVVDARKSPPKTLKTILRGCQQALYKKIRVVLIVQPEKFLNQQKINMDLIMEGYDFKTLLISVHKLTKYIDITQLTAQFGGTFSYDPETWANDRQRVESVLTQLSTRKQDFLINNSELVPSQNDDLLREAELLAVQLDQSVPNTGNQAAVTAIRSAMKDLEVAASRPEREAQAQKEKKETQENNRMLEEHAEGVNRLLDWIEGAGEKWLLTLHEIGESRDEARQLVKEHHQLAVKAKEVRTHSEDLAELATRLMAAVPAHAITLEKARDQVRLVADQFGNRVERQTDMATRSEQFHTLFADLTRKTDLLLETLCTDPKVSDLKASEAERTSIEEKVAVMEKVFEMVCDTGSGFIDDLASCEYNTLGKKITRDYSAGIVHIRDQLCAARDRRRRCLDLVDVRRLKLQQFVQLFTCENDANQAIKWLEELHETLLKDYNQIGCDENDLQCLREDRMRLEETARSTYEYGKQLCQVGMVLRRSLRLDSSPQSSITEKLEQTWGRLCRALSENEAKLNVTDAFNSTIIEIRRRIEELERKSREKTIPARSSEGILAIERRRLGEDIRELSHIRDMLTAQINANHNSSVEVRQAAIAGIRRKVETIQDRQRKMESLFVEEPSPSSEALERAAFSYEASPEPGRRFASQSEIFSTQTRNKPAAFQDCSPVSQKRPSFGVEHNLSMRETTQGMGSIRLSDTESYL